MIDRPANRLADETSPYLLQHAHNPVDWYPWGDEAFARARREDKPVFLSVGYAACHWCHVMERESFEDEATAALMNERFVSIKVDREERPDVDGIYMDAVQAMNQGQGGWPMSVFLTPDGKPFYAGTYFPREPRLGMPSFAQVLEGLSQAWDERRDEIEQQGARLVEAVARSAAMEGSGEPLGEEIEREAAERLRRAFDATWGGFGGAPKFPQPMTLEFLLRMAVRGGSDARDMVALTLDRMAAGGINDHVGGGFARYATDATWRVPHFEKMLYDNAQLAQLYARTWLVTRDDRLRQTARRTLDYLVREMQHADGGFFSSQDADSEGVEGKFYTWAWGELTQLVDEPVAAALGATPVGNWEGTNILWRPAPIGVLAEHHGVDAVDLERQLDEARSVLFGVRERRPRPATDDKVLTAWNALAIRAFAEAGRAFDEPAYVAVAVRCAEFVRAQLRDDRGRLLRSWRDGVSGGPGFADDYALLTLGFLSLFETTGQAEWFDAAGELGEDLMRLFFDDAAGGFFQTGSDAERLIVRPKDLYDNAVPSGNSAAAEALLRLALLTGEASFERAGISALGLVRDVMAQAPTGFGHALCALDLSLGPSQEIAVVGDPSDPATVALLDEVFRARYLPNAVVAVSDPRGAAAQSVPLLRERTQLAGRPTAYVCERFACQMPVVEPPALGEQLSVSST